MTSPSVAWPISSAFTKSGVFSTTGVSRPLNTTCLAPLCTPACASTALSGTPRQRALPIAPLADWPPGTRGSEKPRLLPEHWLTATISTEAMRFRSASLSFTGLSTLPLMSIV